MNVFDFDHDFIKESLLEGINCRKQDIGLFPKSQLKAIYFAGRTLCLDIRTKDQPEMITLCHEDEDWGLFSDGTRRLLTLENLRLMEQLMDICGVNYNNKITITIIITTK